jgi:hypothetical protein
LVHSSEAHDSAYIVSECRIMITKDVKTGVIYAVNP